MKRLSIWLLMLVVCLFLFSCATDDDDDDDDPTPSDDDTTEEETIEIDWVKCSLEENENDGLALCGTAEVPLFWQTDDERTITVAAKWWPAAGDKQGQLWLIEGGPGASGMMSFPPFMKELRAAMPQIDLFVIDHRGVGYSSHLSCPAQEAEDSEDGAYLSWNEFADCADYLNEELGDGLQGYSTTMAAHDLAAFIDATREDDLPVFVWGGSYGTYLLERYLLLHPDQVDGAILDSIHSANRPGIEFSHWRNENGKLLMQRCAEDAFCASKLGSDPWQRLEQLHEKLDAGHCPALGIDHYTLSYLLGWLAWYSPLNATVPSFIYRLDRCDTSDVNAIVYLWYNVFNGSGDLLGLDGEWWSQVLNANISLSDQFWGPDFDNVDLEKYFSDLWDEVLVGDITTMETYDLYLMWPRYDDPDSRKLPQTDIPVLMMQGELDGSTPLGQAVDLTESLSGPNHYWLLFPNSAHGVASDSWMASDPEGETCGIAILREFIEDPSVKPDTSCIDQTLPIDFAGSAEMAHYMYGIDDLWENE